MPTTADYIKEKLTQIPVGSALKLYDLVEDVHKKWDAFPKQHIRVSILHTIHKMAGLKIVVGSDSFAYISRLASPGPSGHPAIINPYIVCGNCGAAIHNIWEVLDIECGYYEDEGAYVSKAEFDCPSCKLTIVLFDRRQ